MRLKPTTSGSTSRTLLRPTLAALRARLREEAHAGDALFLQRYFKTGAGEYGAGDRFLGIRVPVLRKLAREFRELSLENRWRLLKSPWHEERMLALLLLVEAHQRAGADERATLVTRYLEHSRYINNWDLVDCSATSIVGPAIATRGLPWLRRLARSALLWDRRIAVLATFWCIREGDFGPSLDLAAMLLDDQEDLMHKAVGWMLREVGTRDRLVEQAFLRAHHARLPRTTLRYAIEHFPAPERQQYLSGSFHVAGAPTSRTTGKRGTRHRSGGHGSPP